MIIIAYVDPGLGLLAWQAAVAAVLGSLFYVKKTRTWLARLIQKPFRSAKPPSEPGPISLQVPDNDARQ